MRKIRRTVRRIKNRTEDHYEKVKDDIQEIRKQTVEKLAALITTGFGIVAAIAWNDAIKGFIARQEFLKQWGPWVYAFLITIIAVVLTVWISRLSARINQ